jgi:hypothetical protein
MRSQTAVPCRSRFTLPSAWKNSSISLTRQASSSQRSALTHATTCPRSPSHTLRRRGLCCSSSSQRYGGGTRTVDGGESLNSTRYALQGTIDASTKHDAAAARLHTDRCPRGMAVFVFCCNAHYWPQPLAPATWIVGRSGQWMAITLGGQERCFLLLLRTFSTLPTGAVPEKHILRVMACGGLHMLPSVVCVLSIPEVRGTCLSMC